MHLGEVSTNAIESAMRHLVVSDFLHPLHYVFVCIVDYLIGPECFQLGFLFVLAYEVDRLQNRIIKTFNLSCS